jgi:hypothetical protein
MLCIELLNSRNGQQVYQGDGVLVNVDVAVRRGRTMRWAAQHSVIRFPLPHHGVPRGQQSAQCSWLMQLADQARCC